MLIKSVNIYKCKRFPLYGEDRLSVEFDKPAIMIKGINGSGKTSLFSFLSPLPMDKNDFESGGSFEITIIHRGQTYILTSDFTNRSPKYSFNLEGEELNESNNISTQRTLVELHFGITQNLFDFMYGRELFTETTLAGRKKLFSTFTKLNIDGVLRGYGKLNEQFNLNKLMLKNELKQLKTEESKLISEEDYKKLSNTLKEIQQNIDYFLDMRGNLSRYFNPESSESSLNDLKHLLKEKEQIEKENYVLITTNPYNTLNGRRESIREKVINGRSQLEFLYRELENLQVMEKSMIDNELEDKDVLSEKIEVAKEHLKRNHENILYVDEEYYFDPHIENVYFRLYDHFKDFIHDMHTNIVDGEMTYSRNKLEEVNRKIDTLMEEFRQINTEERTLTTNVHKAKELSIRLECPSCHHNWDLQDVIKFEEATSRIKVLSKRRTEIETIVKELNQYKENCMTFYEQFKIIQQLRKESEKYIPKFWKEVDDHNYIHTSPSMLMTNLNHVNSDKSLVKSNIILKDEIRLLNERFKLLDNFKGDNLQGVRLKIEKVNRKIVSIINRNRAYQDELDTISKAETVYKVIEKLNRSITYTKDNVREYNLSTVTSSLMTLIDNHIRELRLRSSELDGVVHNQDSIRYTIKGLNERISDIEETIRVLDLTLKELSPKNGLIARTISSFLNTIINNVNKTLERIWSYKMVIMPMDLERSDLDYRFKIQVEDELDVGDISLASKGMKEAINLAFKLVLYKIHNFNNYPLYLDELASNMDEGHTAKMSQLVHSFVYESDFSQVFIISHKENMGFIKDVDVVELS